MKRLVIAAMVLALVGAFAFADGPTLKWQGHIWSGLGIASVGSTTNVEGYDYNWVGPGAARFDLDILSADGNAGFNSRLQLVMPDVSSGAGAFTGVNAVYNQLNAWGKFFNGVVTVRGGLLDDYTIATPVWNTYGTTDGKFGIYLNIAPIEGLDIGYFQVIPNAAVGISEFLSSSVAGSSIVGLAYTMKDVAKVEAGAILSSGAQSATNGTLLYLGGNLSAVKGLTAQFETEISLFTTTQFIALEQLAYTMGMLTVGTYVYEKSDGTNFYWGAEPSVAYKLTDNLTVNVLANVYNNPSMTVFAPMDAGSVVAFFGGNPGDTNFGAGLNLSYAMSGVTFIVGDYYCAATNAGNMFYVNVDLAL